MGFGAISPIVPKGTNKGFVLRGYYGNGSNLCKLDKAKRKYQKNKEDYKIK